MDSAVINFIETAIEEIPEGSLIKVYPESKTFFFVYKIVSNANYLDDVYVKYLYNHGCSNKKCTKFDAEYIRAGKIFYWYK